MIRWTTSLICSRWSMRISMGRWWTSWSTSSSRRRMRRRTRWMRRNVTWISMRITEPICHSICSRSYMAIRRWRSDWVRWSRRTREERDRTHYMWRFWQALHSFIRSICRRRCTGLRHCVWLCWMRHFPRWMPRRWQAVSRWSADLASKRSSVRRTIRSRTIWRM